MCTHFTPTVIACLLPFATLLLLAKCCEYPPKNVVECTPKVAEELIKLRPFSSDQALFESLSNVIEELSFEEKVRIICKSPIKVVF